MNTLTTTKKGSILLNKVLTRTVSLTDTILQLEMLGNNNPKDRIIRAAKRNAWKQFSNNFKQ